MDEGDERMKLMKGKSYDVCEWCGSTKTVWDTEPDAYIHRHPPEVTEDGKLYVTLSRYCRKCECCYDVILRFDVNDGLRVDEVEEGE